MNRQQRRAAARRQTVSLPKSQEKLIAGMYKNGITEKHLKDNFDLGMEAGRREAIYSCYAAAAKEAIDNVNERFGLNITFADPFGHVEEA